jgi:hypothetical protein
MKGKLNNSCSQKQLFKVSKKRVNQTLKGLHFKDFAESFSTLNAKTTQEQT